MKSLILLGPNWGDGNLQDSVHFKLRAAEL